MQNGNKLYTLETGIQASLDTQKNRTLSLHVDIKDIPFAQGNPYLTQAYNFKLEVGRNDGRKESREEVYSGILSQLTQINQVINANGSGLPGFESQLNTLTNRLTGEVMTYQEGNDRMSEINDLPIPDGSNELKSIEELLKNHDGVIYLPGIVSG